MGEPGGRDRGRHSPGTDRHAAHVRELLRRVRWGSTTDVEEIEGRGDRALVVSRPQIRGESSGAVVVGPQVGLIFTLADGLITRIEWHYDVDEARARFEQGS